MRIFGLLSALAALAANTSASAQITPEEAQSLPDAELARRVLGEVGRLVMHVSRPTWSTLEPLPHTGAPPLRFMDFDLRAQDRWTDGWSGICQAQRLTVSFDQSGNPDSTRTTMLVGLAGSLRRTPREHARDVQPCAEITTLDDFFYADNTVILGGVDATIVAVQQIADYLAGSTKIDFSLSCKPEKMVVACRRQDWKIDARDIDDVLEMSCDKDNVAKSESGLRCFRISLARSTRGRPTFNFVGIYLVMKSNNNDTQIVSAQLWQGQGMTETAF